MTSSHQRCRSRGHSCSSTTKLRLMGCMLLSRQLAKPCQPTSQQQQQQDDQARHLGQEHHQLDLERCQQHKHEGIHLGDPPRLPRQRQLQLPVETLAESGWGHCPWPLVRSHQLHGHELFT